MKNLFYILVLSVLFGGTDSQAQLTNEECDEIYGKYTRMLHRYQKSEDQNLVIMANWYFSTVNERLGDPREWIKKLNIECSMNELRTHYEKHGVLMLRPLKGNELLLGCGNVPVESPYHDNPHHKHEGYDTINPMLSMNSTIVAAFGEDDLEGLLPTGYKKVVFEAFTPSKTDHFFKHFSHHCKEADIIERGVGESGVSEQELKCIDDIFWE